MATNLLTKKGNAVANLQVFRGEKIEDSEEPNRRRMGRTGRLQLVLPEQSVDRLEALKEVTEAASYAEVIRRALRLYEGLLAETEAGGDILVRRQDGTEEKVPLHRAL